jgi:hypothetical protein
MPGGSPAAGRLTDLVIGRLRATRVGSRIADDLVRAPADPARQHALGEALYDLVSQDPRLADEIAALAETAAGAGSAGPGLPGSGFGPATGQPGPGGFPGPGGVVGPGGVPPQAPPKKKKKWLIFAIGLPILAVGLCCFGIFGLPVIATLIATNGDGPPKVTLTGSWYDQEHHATFTFTDDGKMTIHIDQSPADCTGHTTNTSDNGIWTVTLDSDACKIPMPVGQSLEGTFSQDSGVIVSDDRSTIISVARVNGPAATATR